MADEQLPAVVDRAVPDVTRRQEVEEAFGKIIGTEWGSLAKMKPEEATEIARIVHTDWPEWGAVDVMRFVECLGGRLYFTAEFWEDQANQIEEYDGAVPERIMPGTPAWDKFASKTDPNIIMCLVQTHAYRSDRRFPSSDFNYVLVTDPIIQDYQSHKLGTKNEAEAKELLESVRVERGADSATIYWANWRNYQGYVARLGFLKPDAELMAMKKCLTTSLRRALIKAFSTTHAKTLTVAAQVEERFKLVQDRYHAELAKLEAPAAVVEPEDEPYALPEPRAPQLPPGATRSQPEPSERATTAEAGPQGEPPPDESQAEGFQPPMDDTQQVTAPPSKEEPIPAQLPEEEIEGALGKPIEVGQRKMLLALVRERDISGLDVADEMEALKKLCGRVMKVAPSKVTTSGRKGLAQVRMKHFVEIVTEINKLPERAPSEGPAPDDTQQGRML